MAKKIHKYEWKLTLAYKAYVVVITTAMYCKVRTKVSMRNSNNRSDNRRPLISYDLGKMNKGQESITDSFPSLATGIF